MGSKSFCLNGWHHVMPEKNCSNKGRLTVICRLCFGPLETDSYGIENDKFYHEREYIEGVLENEVDFFYISKEEFVKELDYEIELSIEHESDKLTQYLLDIKDALVDC